MTTDLALQCRIAADAHRKNAVPHIGSMVSLSARDLMAHANLLDWVAVALGAQENVIEQLTKDRDEARSELARIESLHRSEIAAMADRFRAVNVAQALQQLGVTECTILPPGTAELDDGQAHTTAEAARRIASDKWTAVGLGPVTMPEERALETGSRDKTRDYHYDRDGMDDSIIKWDDRSLNDNLQRYQREMEADPATLRRLIQTEDTFASSVTVYTFDGAEIIEKKCEEPGWPNVTHDGCMMYENTYSTDKNQVVEWAKRNCASSIKSFREAIANEEEKLERFRIKLATRQADLKALEKAFPRRIKGGDA